MSYLDKMRPGMRENAFYVKTRIQNSDAQIEAMRMQQNKIYIYEWDASKNKYIGHLVDAAEYYRDYEWRSQCILNKSNTQ